MSLFSLSLDTIDIILSVFKFLSKINNIQSLWMVAYRLLNNSYFFQAYKKKVSKNEGSLVKAC